RGDIHLRRRELQPHLLQRVRDDLRDGEIAKPLVVGRDDVPGRVLRARLLHGVLERLDVGGPELALGVVGLADLPVAPGVLEPLVEAGELLLRADMEVELSMRVPFSWSAFSKLLISSSPFDQTDFGTILWTRTTSTSS